MFNEYPCIILGAGNSVPFPENKPEPKLKGILESNCSIGLNSCNLFGYNTTFLSFVDGSFYNSNPYWLKTVPLIIGKICPEIFSTWENTILLPYSKQFWGLNAWDIHYKKCGYCDYKINKSENLIKTCPHCTKSTLIPIGIYSNYLSGLFSLSLAIALSFKTIYLLGFDCVEINNKTHFYQDLILDNKKFRGVGKDKKGRQLYRTTSYNTPTKLNEIYFAPFQDALKEGIKIYNVSEQSILTGFPKINYTTFYNMIGDCSVNQDEIRKEIKDYIIEKTK